MLANMSLRSRPVVRAAVLLAIAGALVGGFTLWYFVFREAGPPPVDIAALAPVATAQASTAPTTTAIAPVASSTTAATATATAAPAATSAAAPITPATATPTTAAASGVDGTWQVDTSIGSFADFTNSFVGYRVQEQLASIGATTAVGRTPEVSGSLTIAGTTVTAVEITADLTALESDERNRDRQLQRQGIETGTFPTATFVLTSPIELGSIPADGTATEAVATGDLTLHGVTNRVEITLQAKLSGDTIIVAGSLPIAFADYDIAKPTSFNVLTIADNGIMEMQLFFTKA